MGHLLHENNRRYVIDLPFGVFLLFLGYFFVVPQNPGSSCHLFNKLIQIFPLFLCLSFSSLSFNFLNLLIFFLPFFYILLSDNLLTLYIRCLNSFTLLLPFLLLLLSFCFLVLFSLIIDLTIPIVPPFSQYRT